jgi:hypothetical protein
LTSLEQELAACREQLSEPEQRKLRLMLARRWKTVAAGDYSPRLGRKE